MARIGAGKKLAGTKRRLTQLVCKEGGFNGRVLIDLGRDGTLLVDRHQVLLSKRTSPAQTSLTMELPDLDQFLGGQLTAQMLLMTRRLTISGRMGEAMRFARHLEMAIYGRSALPV